MKLPNDKWLESYKNRVSQFEKQEKLKTDADTLRSKGKAPKHPDKIAEENPYLKARVQVLKSYPEGRKIELAAMERDGNVDNRHYAKFIIDIIDFLEEGPSLKIRRYACGMDLTF